MKLIGLSGGPGCGKSAASQFFKEAGVCVIDADQVCREIYEEKENPVLDALRARWGERIFSPEGLADRKKIAEIVFNEEKERQFLDSVMHPEIFRRLDLFLAEQKTSWAMVEAALLFEARWEKKMFRTVCVWALPEIRMERLLSRGWTRDHAQKRIDSQIPDSRKLELADYGIINNGSLETLQMQCERIRKQIEKNIHII